jgi:hypothetical protein
VTSTELKVACDLVGLLPLLPVLTDCLARHHHHACQKLTECHLQACEASRLLPLITRCAVHRNHKACQKLQDRLAEGLDSLMEDVCTTQPVLIGTCLDLPILLCITFGAIAPEACAGITDRKVERG